MTASPSDPTRLSALDAAYLAVGRRRQQVNSPTFVIEVAGSAPEQDTLLDHVSQCVARMPRLRQRVRRSGLGLRRPLWVEDVSFALEQHVGVKHVQNEDELRMVVDQCLSEPIDLDKPPWDLRLVTGHSTSGFVLLLRVHHAVGDGDALVNQVLAEFFKSRDDPPILLAPGHRISRRRDAVLGLAELLADTTRRPAPRVAELNGPLGTDRHLHWSTSSVRDYAVAAERHGGSINDIFLTALGGALRDWLGARQLPLPADLAVGVPVNLRSHREAGALGNRLAGFRLHLPLGPSDPTRRHVLVLGRMQALKSGRQLEGAMLEAELSRLVPTPFLGTSMRLRFSRRVVNLMASNIAGPSRPATFIGRRVVSIVPGPPLPPRHRLIAQMSTYANTVSVAVVADSSVGDADAIVASIGEHVSRLVGDQ